MDCIQGDCSITHLYENRRHERPGSLQVLTTRGKGVKELHCFRDLDDCKWRWNYPLVLCGDFNMVLNRNERTES